MIATWAGVFGDLFRLLSFRASRDQMEAWCHRHLVLGLLFAWLAGMGRYWDNPKAELLQQLGVGSVAYVFALSLLLWLMAWPMRPAGWTYTKVLTFVALTSPPAVLYAIPVERFMPMDVAAQTNMWFLAVVAVWRVALLFFFFLRWGQLGWVRTVVTALLPLGLIVVSLALLNLEHVVFDIMSGTSSEHRSANDKAYGLVVGLALMSYMAAPILALVYAGLAGFAWWKRRQSPPAVDEAA